MATPDQRSVEAYRSLRDRFAQAMLAPVHNEMFGPAHRDKYPLVGGSPVMVLLPVLAPGLRRYIERYPLLIRRFEYGRCRRHTARRAYRAAAMVAPNLFRVPGTRFTHITRRFAGFNPARRLNLFFLGTGADLARFFRQTPALALTE